MREQIMGRFVGARVRRVEDRRLLSGRGRYVDDVVVPDMAHAAFVRSPLPHALIRGIDTTRATAVKGVHAILTGADIAAITNPLMGMLALPGLYDPWHWALAVDRVRLVGDPVAIVVATSRAVAEDAAEMIDVDYEELEPIATLAHARDPGRPAIWPKAKGNIVYAASESFGDVDAVFGGADRVISETFRQHRHSNQPMETRGTVAEVDADGNLTLHAAHQAAHSLKWAMALCLARKPVRMSMRDMFRRREQTKAIFAGAREFVRAHPKMMKDSQSILPTMLRQMARDPMRMVHLNRAFLGLMATPTEQLPHVVTGDIGGAFGSKNSVLREDIALCAAALRLGRSIKWIEDRNENLVLGGQARDEQVAVEAAVMNDGTVRGLRAKLTMDAGAYPAFPFGAPMFCRIIQTMFPGPYRFDAMQFDIEIVTSNKAVVRRLPGPMGGRNLGPGTAIRCHSARVEDEPGRHPPAQHRRSRHAADDDGHRSGPRCAHVGQNHPRAGSPGSGLRTLARAPGGGPGAGSPSRPRDRDLHRSGSGPARVYGLRHARLIGVGRGADPRSPRKRWQRHGAHSAGAPWPRPRDNARTGGGRRTWRSR